MKHTRICEQCGREFTTYQSARRPDPPRFCSIPCRAAWQRGPGHPRYKGEWITVQGGHPRAFVWIDEATRARLGITRAEAPRARVNWLLTHPGETLTSHDHIHHKDEDTLNDSPENLVKLSPKRHIEEHGGPPHRNRRVLSAVACAVCGKPIKARTDRAVRFCSRACNAKGQAGPDNPNRGKPFSEERKRAISEAKRGQKHSPEARERMCQAARARWAKS